MTFLVVTVCVCIWSPPGRVISPHQDVCEVHAQAVFPSLQVVNVCGGGSLGNLSKLNLWKLFSLDSLNEQLLWNPSPAELTSRLPNKHRLSPYKTSILWSTWVKFFIIAPDALMHAPSTENRILNVHIINVYVRSCLICHFGFNFCHFSFTNAALEFNFSAAPLNSDPSTIILMLYNPGSLSVEW